MDNEEEYLIEADNSTIISQTDLKGIITFVNRKFCNVSGYKKSELIGKNHNVVRHPDMPKALFKKIWEKISHGETWNGLLKNLRSNGQYYWLNAEITPVYNEQNEIVGYIAIKKPADNQEILASQELYQKMLLAEEGR